MSQFTPGTNEPAMQPDYEKAEMDLLRAALKRTYTERFEMMMQLIKLNLMLKKAVITHRNTPQTNG